jgi:hypothetical protein
MGTFAEDRRVNITRVFRKRFHIEYKTIVIVITKINR